MLKKEERVSKTSFPDVLKGGQTLNSDNLNLKFTAVKQAPSKQKNQYSFVVSTKVSSLATIRNLLKRRARYIIRKHINKIKTPFIYIFLFKPGSAKLNFLDLEKEILNILTRVRIH